LSDRCRAPISHHFHDGVSRRKREITCVVGGRAWVPDQTVRSAILDRLRWNSAAGREI